MTPAIAARGLTKRYGDTAAVDAIDLTVERGELFGFLGPNGAGKTTTIRMALGLILPTGGEVDLLGETVRTDHAPLERVGALVEEPAFWKYLSGRKNLEYFARAGGTRADVRARLGKVDEVLETVGLTAAADKRVKAYSQGMRQRLGIGLALLGAPELLVLDEPTNGLDPSGMREMRLLLRRLADDGTTIFVSSHLLAEVEAMCDRVGVMAYGRLVALGPPGSLRGDADGVRLEVDDAARRRCGRPCVRRRVVDRRRRPTERAGRAAGVGGRRATPWPRSTRRWSGRGSASMRSCPSAPRSRTSSSRSWRAPMFRVELAKAFHRWRTYLLAAAIGGIPIVIVFALKVSPPDPGAAEDAPPFLFQITSNGLFAALTGLAVVQPFFLPLATGLFAGDAVAGEAQSGTLRYLLLRPVRRTRLVLAKYCSSMTLLGGLVLVTLVSGVVAGAVVFGLSPLPTLSGSTLSVTEGLARVGASGVYMLAVLSGIACIGLCISTRTDSGPGAAVATIVIAIASQIMDQIPSLDAIHPFLPTHGWLGFTGLFRFPVDWAPMRAGLAVSAAYTVVFLTAAVVGFRRRDVTS